MGSIPRGIPRLSNECCGVENSLKLKVQAMNPGLVGFKYFLCFCIILHQSDHRILSTGTLSETSSGYWWSKYFGECG